MPIYVIKEYRVLILDVMSVQGIKFIPRYDNFYFVRIFLRSVSLFYIFTLDL